MASSHSPTRPAEKPDQRQFDGYSLRRSVSGRTAKLKFHGLRQMKGGVIDSSSPTGDSPYKKDKNMKDLPQLETGTMVILTNLTIGLAISWPLSSH